MRNKLALILIIFLVFLVGGGMGYFLPKKLVKEGPRQEENKYINYINEIRQVIKDNYWNKIDDQQLNKIVVLGTEKLTGLPQNTSEKKNEDVEKMLKDVLEKYDSDDKRKEFTNTLMDMVLSNLEPFGRSRLYTIKDEKALSDNVSNKTDVDQYEVLDVPKEASASVIKKAYDKAIANAKTDEEKTKVEKAYKVLSDPAAKKNYDIAGVEPTFDYKLIKPNVFYMHLTKFSPTTVDELMRVSEKTSGRDEINSLIFDLRDNIGGAIDSLPYFLGPFIGNDQYAYQFLHQGEKIDFKTKVGWLPGLTKFKKVVILINGNSQSTAEVVAATLKKYNVGVVIGTATKGWGTVERVFEVKNQLDPKEKNSVFLVHSLTLREDGMPIEGKGVDPVINVTDKNWGEQLNSYFDNKGLIEAVKEIVAQK